MKIADYGKAITSYIESPTTAQKIISKTKANRILLAEVPTSERDNFNTPDLEQSPDSFLRPGETLEDFDVTFRRPNSSGGRVQLAEGATPKEKPFTLDQFKNKANIYVGALFNNALPLMDIKSALNKFTTKGIEDGTFTADEAIKVVQDLRSSYRDLAQKQRLRGVIEEVEREDFDRGGVAQVKAYVESLPKNTVITRKLIKDFIDANDVNVNFNNLFSRKGPSYVGNFIKDKSITVDPSYAASVGDTKKYKKSKAIINNPKKLKEFIKYGNQKGVSIKDIRNKFNISAEEFYEGGLRELFDKDFQLQASKQIKPKTINNINKLLNDSEAASFLKKGNIVPDNVLAKLKILPSEAATATVRIGQIYGGNNFGIDDFKKIRKNVKASDKLFDTMNKFAFGNPYRSNLYRTSLQLIDQQLGNEKGTFESLKKKASYILKKNKIKGFDINEIAGVSGTAKTGAGEFSQFIDVLDTNLNQKQGASFQSAFSQARQKIANNPAVFETEAKKINRLASKFESEYGFKLPRIRKLEDVEKFYSAKRLKDLTAQGIDIKKASEKLGYTIEMPTGAVTLKEFVEKPGLKEKFLKGIGTGAKAFGKVIKPVGYAIGTAAAYQAKSIADEMGIELKPQDYFMAVDSGDPEIAINNWKRRNDPQFAVAERAKDLAQMSDDFEEVGQTTFGKYNDQIKNIKLP